MGHGFYCCIEYEAYKNNTKIIQKFTVRPKGCRTIAPLSEYATASYFLNTEFCPNTLVLILVT